MMSSSLYGKHKVPVGRENVSWDAYHRGIQPRGMDGTVGGPFRQKVGVHLQVLVGFIAYSTEICFWLLSPSYTDSRSSSLAMNCNAYALLK